MKTYISKVNGYKGVVEMPAELSQACTYKIDSKAADEMANVRSLVAKVLSIAGIDEKQVSYWVFDCLPAHEQSPDTSPYSQFEWHTDPVSLIFVKWGPGDLLIAKGKVVTYVNAVVSFNQQVFSLLNADSGVEEIPIGDGQVVLIDPETVHLRENGEPNSGYRYRLRIYLNSSFGVSTE